jgi:flagellin
LISLIQTAEGALNETHSILQRMRELATQAANDTNTGSDRGEIQKEINQLTSEINRIGNTTEFNTQKVLQGNSNGTVNSDYTATFQIGANEGQNFEITINDMRAQALGLAGTTAEDTATGDAKFAAASVDGNSNVLTDVSTDGVDEYALDVTDNTKASAAISVIDDAIGKVSSERSRLGAYQNRLDHTINNLSTSSENLTAAESRIRDVDYALVA